MYLNVTVILSSYSKLLQKVEFSPVGTKPHSVTLIQSHSLSSIFKVSTDEPPQNTNKPKRAWSIILLSHKLWIFSCLNFFLCVHSVTKLPLPNESSNCSDKGLLKCFIISLRSSNYSSILIRYLSPHRYFVFWRKTRPCVQLWKEAKYVPYFPFAAPHFHLVALCSE